MSHEIKELNGSSFEVYKKEFVSANILDVEVGTTGYRGGDFGHGGRTYFKITNTCSGTIAFKSYGDDNLLGDTIGSGVEAFIAGDCELETMIDALKYIVEVLESQANNDNKGDSDE